LAQLRNFNFDGLSVLLIAIVRVLEIKSTPFSNLHMYVNKESKKCAKALYEQNFFLKSAELLTVSKILAATALKIAWPFSMLWFISFSAASISRRHSILVRQTGQVLSRCSQGSMQARWKMCYGV
jgi:hypothetical protein